MPDHERPGKYVRDHYRVPAYIGGRVAYTWGERHGEGTRYGTITGFDGQYLIVKLDGEGKVRRRDRFHPTWEIEYLGTDDARG